MYIYIHTYIYKDIYAHIHVYIYKYTCIHVHIFTYMHTHTHPRSRTSCVHDECQQSQSPIVTCERHNHVDIRNFTNFVTLNDKSFSQTTCDTWWLGTRWRVSRTLCHELCDTQSQVIQSNNIWHLMTWDKMTCVTNFVSPTLWHSMTSHSVKQHMTLDDLGQAFINPIMSHTAQAAPWNRGWNLAYGVETRTHPFVWVVPSDECMTECVGVCGREEESV